MKLIKTPGKGVQMKKKTSVADPCRKNADADPGKYLNADADSFPY
jgi:hypothetical protein